MTAEIPIEIVHLPSKMREIFGGKLPEAISGSDLERERNFQSRALGAYALLKLAGATIEEAVGAIVDGGGDGGIDAIFHSVTSNILWVVQSKFISNGRGEPELGEVTKFKTGLENLLQGNFQAFRDNQLWVQIIPRLQIIFDAGGLQVRSVLVYSGINIVSDDRLQLFEELKRRFSFGSDYLDKYLCNLTTVHGWLTGADQGPGVPKVEMKIMKPGWVASPYETIYGLLSLEDIYALYALYGKKIITANIRSYKGSTDVNEDIVLTVTNEPEHFFYLNNGLTAYCERLEVHNLDRGNAESKRITAYGLSIVNGAQTLGSVADFFTTLPLVPPEGFVFIKIISLEKCSDDREFADRITRSTNFQNKIEAQDFVALDEQQESIANQLKLSGIIYHFKTDTDEPAPDSTNFNLNEATTASACLSQQEDCDFCSRIIANRRSLWSLDEIYPVGEGFRSRYSRVFRSDRSARNVWRAVQTQRLVNKVMKENANASTGIRKAFFENARWIVLNVLFLKLHPELGDALSLTANEESEITRIAIEFAEMLFQTAEALGFVSRRIGGLGGAEPFEQTRHFRSVFSMAGDCRSLRNGLLARMSNPPD